MKLQHVVKLLTAQGATITAIEVHPDGGFKVLTAALSDAQAGDRPQDGWGSEVGDGAQIRGRRRANGA
jgi:hypothetical protein